MPDNRQCNTQHTTRLAMQANLQCKEVRQSPSTTGQAVVPDSAHNPQRKWCTQRHTRRVRSTHSTCVMSMHSTCVMSTHSTCVRSTHSTCVRSTHSTYTSTAFRSCPPRGQCRRSRRRAGLPGFRRSTCACSAQYTHASSPAPPSMNPRVQHGTRPAC